MKFTKILVIFLALTMLLVSCNSTGNGAVTTEPGSTTVEPDITTSEPATTPEPFGTIPSSPEATREYVYYDGELIDLATLPTPENALCLQPLYYSYHLTSACEREPISFVIQFTATDYATMYVGDEAEEYFFRSWAIIGGTIKGTVDAVYATGSAVSMEVGSEIELGVRYMIDVESENFYLAYNGTNIFRKGYSYILLGYYEEGIYVASLLDVYQISSTEHTRAFYASLGVPDVRDFGCSEDVLAKVLEKCPPVKPTKLEN